MSSTVLYMSMSLDGFIAEPNVSRHNGPGDGGARLHEWIFGAHGPEEGHPVADHLRVADQEMWTEFMSTGAD